MDDSRVARNLNDVKLLLYQSIKSNEGFDRRIDVLQAEKKMLSDRLNRGRLDWRMDLDPLKLDLLQLDQVRDVILVRQRSMAQKTERLKDLIEGVKKDVDKFHEHVENLQAKCDEVNCSIIEERFHRKQMMAEIKSVKLRTEKLGVCFDRTVLNSEIAKEKSLRDAQLKSNEDLKNVQIQLFNDQLLQEQRMARLQEMIAKARMRASECEQVRKAMFQQWSQEQHERIQDNST